MIGPVSPGTDNHALTLTKGSRHIRLALVLVLCVVMVWLSGYWIDQAEIYSIACSVSGAVPTIPSLAALLLLLCLRPLFRRLRGVRELSTGEIVVVYVFLTLSTMMFGIGGMRHLMAAISEHRYLSTAAEPVETLAQFIPAWLSPQSATVHRWMWESSPSGAVPWHVWWIPIVAWTGFFLLLGGTILCLLLLLAERWLDHERLSFPLARLPLEILGEGTLGALFANSLTWVGIGVATLLNAFHMVRGVFFGGPNYGGPVFYIHQLGLSYPWLVLGHEPPILFAVQPGLIGLGYLVSNEVAISVILFTIFSKALGLGLVSAGIRDGWVPYAKQQAFGGYLMLAAIMLWMGRGAMVEGWHKLVGGQEEAHGRGQAGRPNLGWALLGAMVGFAGVVIFLVAAGMALWLAITYMAVIVLSSVTYARVRAETGMPLLWARPYTTEYLAIWEVLGGRIIVPAGRDLTSPTIFAMTSFLSRTGFPSVSGYQIEGIKLCRQTGVNWRQIATLMMMAVGLGIACGFIFHLVPFYQEGAIALPGGHWNLGAMRQAYARVLQNAQSPEPPDINRIAAIAFGALVTILVSVARTRWTGVPLHPVGYVMANCQYGCWLFPTFVMVWTCKTLLLRYGGSRLYLRMMPAFLGLALGHFLSGGLVWGSLSAALGGPFLRWSVWVN